MKNKLAAALHSPFHYGLLTGKEDQHRIYADHGRTVICTMNDSSNDSELIAERARLIVHAVNNHYRLLEALKKLLETIPNVDRYDYPTEQQLEAFANASDAAEKAITEAEGENHE